MKTMRNLNLVIIACGVSLASCRMAQRDASTPMDSVTGTESPSPESLLVPVEPGVGEINGRSLALTSVAPSQCYNASRSSPSHYGDVYGGWSVGTGSKVITVGLAATALYYHTGLPYDISSLGADNFISKWGPWQLATDQVIVPGSGNYNYYSPNGDRDYFVTYGTKAGSYFGTSNYLDVASQGSGIIQMYTKTQRLTFKSFNYAHQGIVPTDTGAPCQVVAGGTVTNGNAKGCVTFSTARFLLMARATLDGKTLESYDRDSSGHLTAIRNVKGTLLAMIDWQANKPYAIRILNDAVTGIGGKTILLDWKWNGRPLLTKVQQTTIGGVTKLTFEYDAKMRLSAVNTITPFGDSRQTLTYAPTTGAANEPVALLSQIKFGDKTLENYVYGTPQQLGVSMPPQIVLLAVMQTYTTNATQPDRQVIFGIDSQCLSRSYNSALSDVTLWDRAAWAPFPIKHREDPFKSTSRCATDITYRDNGNPLRQRDISQIVDCKGNKVTYYMDPVTGDVINQKDQLGNIRNYAYRPIGSNTVCGYNETSFVNCPANTPLALYAVYDYRSWNANTQMVSMTKINRDTTAPHYEVMSISHNNRPAQSFAYTYSDANTPGAYASVATTDINGKATVRTFDKWMNTTGVNYGNGLLTASNAYNSDGLFTTHSDNILPSYITVSYDLPGRLPSGVFDRGETTTLNPTANSLAVTQQILNRPTNTSAATTDGSGVTNSVKVNDKDTAVSGSLDYAPKLWRAAP